MACTECEARVGRLAEHLEQIKVLRLRERHGYEGAIAALEAQIAAALEVLTAGVEADLGWSDLAGMRERTMHVLAGDRYDEVCAEVEARSKAAVVARRERAFAIAEEDET